VTDAGPAGPVGPAGPGPPLLVPVQAGCALWAARRAVTYEERTVPGVVAPVDGAVRVGNGRVCDATQRDDRYDTRRGRDGPSSHDVLASYGGSVPSVQVDGDHDDADPLRLHQGR